MSQLDQETFLAATRCVTKGWYLRQAADVEVETDVEIFEQAEGQHIRDLARRLHFPDAVWLPGDTPRKKAKATAELMRKRSTQALFGATFIADGDEAHADVLVRVPGGWKLVRLTSASQPKPGEKLDRDKIEPAAYVALVAKRAKVRIVAVSLVLLSRAFRKGMDESALFVERNVTARVTKLMAQWAPLAKAARGRRRRARPKPVVVPACDSCEFFETDCLGEGIRNPVTDLPYFRTKVQKVPSLDMAKLPKKLGALRLSPLQQTIVTSARTGKEHIGPEVAPALARIKSPTYYLDFETCATAYPLYPDLAPHDDFVTQYSLHRLRSNGKLAHTDYLADHHRDCRRELAEKLLGELGTKGSIVVYSPYEERQLENLADHLPDLARKLKAVIGRLFDLYTEITKPRYYYHPDFRGSASIKHVLPALAPNLSYKGKTIADGQAAKIAFARLALGEYSDREEARIRKELHEYCQLDSRAMFEIHKALLKRVKPRRRRKK